jgi:hypothetical protein
VDEHIEVETQYEHYIKRTTKQPTQDIKIDEAVTGNQTYIEFQSRINSNPPIAIRASNYNGYAITKMPEGSQNSQIWLLAENDDSVLKRQSISNFRIVEDNTKEYYPREVNIMFVSLPRLSAEDNECGWLAKLLLGYEIGLRNNRIDEIAQMFRHEYNVFKKEEEVAKSMTMLEQYMADGRAEAVSEYNRKIENMRRKRLQRKEPLSSIIDFANDLDFNLERINELINEAGAV